MRYVRKHHGVFVIICALYAGLKLATSYLSLGLTRLLEGSAKLPLCLELKIAVSGALIDACYNCRLNQRADVWRVVGAPKTRFNTGGTPLQPQEIRAALYHGPFSDFIWELNEVKSWREIFGRISRRRKDEELILRYLAFLYSKERYSAPMVKFLNRFMSANRQLKNMNQKQVTDTFEKTFNFVHKTLGSKAFRPVRALNAAAFDAKARKRRAHVIV